MPPPLSGASAIAPPTPAAVAGAVPELLKDGYFDADARRQAAADALPALTTYFVAGQAWKLHAQAALATHGDHLDRELAQALRFRVLLALGRQLEPILHAILDQPSFRYGRRAEHSVGVIAGHLDITRYMRERNQLTAPRRYPIRMVEREVATPENVLATGALHAVLRALNDAPLHLLPSVEGPERRELRDVRSTLTRIGQLPLFATLRHDGDRLAMQGRLQRERQSVLRRIGRREIANPTPYRHLTDWVAHYVAGTCARPGDAMWAFYDHRFDAKLFEIWTLWLVAEAVTARFGQPLEGTPRPLWLRDGRPTATWSTPFGQIELFFQRDASALGLPRRWRVRARDHALGAFPDLVARLTTPDAMQWIIIDAKLRRRGHLPSNPSAPLNLPSDEVYKMLGYFEHLAPGPHPIGALIYYTPGASRTALLERGRAEREDDIDGTLLLAGVDPFAVEASHAVMSRVADLISQQLGEPSSDIQDEARDLAEQALASGADALDAAAVGKERVFREVAASYAARHPRQRETVESTTRAAFPDVIWNELDAESRRMLISAEMYAIHQPDDMDFSGPLLVLSAACERELNLRFFSPLASAHTQTAGENRQPLLPQHPTLGTATFMLRQGSEMLDAQRKGQSGKVQRLLESASTADHALVLQLLVARLDSSGREPYAMTRLVEGLAELNKRYRRPAAHDNPVDKDVWVRGRGVVLGPEQLLSRIVTVFPAPAAV